MIKKLNIVIMLVISSVITNAQEVTDVSLLSLDRIHSNEFRQDYGRRIQWIENGDAYVIIEKSTAGDDELVRYESASIP